MTWGERQGWVNVVEPFRSPFAIGDAHVLTGHFELARPWFEQAFEQVPKGGIDECKVRVNLGLTYEALGDAAKARERTDEWKQFYEKGIAVTTRAPAAVRRPGGRRDRRAARAGAAADGGEERRRSPASSSSRLPRQQPAHAAAHADPRSGQRPEPGAAGPAAGAAAARTPSSATEQHGSDDRVEPDGGVGKLSQAVVTRRGRLTSPRARGNGRRGPSPAAYGPISVLGGLGRR